MTINVGIYIYNEVEVLDFAGPFEVFSTASRVKVRIDPDLPDLFNVFTIGEKMTPVFARGGLQIAPEYNISNHPRNKWNLIGLKTPNKMIEQMPYAEAFLISFAVIVLCHFSEPFCALSANLCE